MHHLDRPRRLVMNVPPAAAAAAAVSVTVDI
jgi:hypothetical protein